MTTGDGNASDLKRWLISFIVSVAAAIIVVTIMSVVTKDEARDSKDVANAAAVTSTELIEAIVESCENNGNPLREVVQEGLNEQIVQSQNEKLYEEFFPEADPAKLDRLIQAQVREYEKRLKKIEPLNCAKQYPDNNK